VQNVCVCVEGGTGFCVSTPGHKLEFHCTTPSTSKVNFDPGSMPKVLGIGALAKRNNVSIVPRNTFRRETLRLKFSLMTWRGIVNYYVDQLALIHFHGTVPPPLRYTSSIHPYLNT
jgi:hypothetical protein